MNVWGTHLRITTGRGNRDRQVVEVKRNVEARSRQGAYDAAIAYAREIGLSVLLDDEDVRFSVDISLGEGCWT